MNWAVGGPSTLLGMIVGMAANALGIGIQTSMRPPMLILQWGDPMRGFLIFGNDDSGDRDYLRFDNIGNPIRAAVTLHLPGGAEQPPLAAHQPDLGRRSRAARPTP